MSQAVEVYSLACSSIDILTLKIKLSPSIFPFSIVLIDKQADVHVFIFSPIIQVANLLSNPE